MTLSAQVRQQSFENNLSDELLVFLFLAKLVSILLNYTVE